MSSSFAKREKTIAAISVALGLIGVFFTLVVLPLAVQMYSGDARFEQMQLQTVGNLRFSAWATFVFFLFATTVNVLITGVKWLTKKSKG